MKPLSSFEGASRRESGPRSWATGRSLLTRSRRSCVAASLSW